MLQRSSIVVVALALVVLPGGCASTGEAPPPDAVAPPSPVETPPEAGPAGAPDVTITARGIEFLIDKFEVEFNRRRGIYAVYGFFPDMYDKLVTVPFRDLARIEFLGMMPRVVFEQATLGREDMNLRADHAFELLLTYRDNRHERFYGFLPKFRGERDFQVWTLGMANNTAGIELIEFDR